MMKQAVSTVDQHLTQIIQNFKTPRLADKYETDTKTKESSQDSSSSGQVKATPLESNVQGRTLKRTYYYRFASGTPDRVKQVFEQAVKAYNKTGIVKLIAGSGSQKQNQIVFSTYNSATKTQANVIELGVGGPEIIQQTGWDAYTANHARAKLNIHYAQAVSLSVAMHELGHAMGLDHSAERSSVMYPVDQGVTNLSRADLAGLKKIYQ